MNTDVQRELTSSAVYVKTLAEVQESQAKGQRKEEPEESKATSSLEQEAPRIRIVSIEEFLALDLKPRDMVLSPVLPTQGLAMTHSWRGVGKTLLSVGVGYATACGGTFLKWQAPKARRVLYIDGELPAAVLQTRLASCVAGAGGEPPCPGYFRIITPDLQEAGIPNLSLREGQTLIETYLDDTELLILDNLSTLCRSGDESGSDDWLPVQDWLLALRRHGLSVLLVHHSGKTGAQRGTSRREDVLDTVLCLKHPKDYQPSDGARFEVHFEKCRGLHGAAALPFEAKMETHDGKAVWLMKSLEAATTERVAQLLKQKFTQRDIAKELEISVGKVNQMVRRVREEGAVLQ